MEVQLEKLFPIRYHFFDQILQVMLIRDYDLCDRGGARTPRIEQQNNPPEYIRADLCLGGGGGAFFHTHTQHTEETFFDHEIYSPCAGSTGLCLLY